MASSSSSSSSSSTSLPTILLVHDAFHPPSLYEPFLAPLRARGFPVLAPPLPTTTHRDPSRTHADDVEVLVRDALEPQFARGAEVVIVAHSLGALPATHCVEGESVAERAACGLRGGICHYVSVCGLAYPERGRNVMGKEEGLPLQSYHRVEDGLIHLMDTAKPIIFNDLEPELVDEMWPQMITTHSLRNFNSLPDFVDKEIVHVPKTYVFCENDLALAVEYQAFFVGHGQYDDVVRVPSGHFPFAKMPDRMVDIICEISKRSSSSSGSIHTP